MRFVFGKTGAFGLHRNVRDFEILRAMLVNACQNRVVLIVADDNRVDAHRIHSGSQTPDVKIVNADNSFYFLQTFAQFR